MEGSQHEDLRRQLKERDAEVSELRRQLEQSQKENDRLRHENEQLRQELKAAGRDSRSATNPGKRAYKELRSEGATAPAVYTDDTGWPIHGEGSHLMAFDTDQATVFQIRSQHRNEEVREPVPADYAGVMVTGRGPSYEAEELSGVKQQKCLDDNSEFHNGLPFQ